MTKLVCKALKQCLSQKTLTEMLVFCGPENHREGGQPPRGELQGQRPSQALRSHTMRTAVSSSKDGVQDRRRKGVSGRPPISEHAQEPPWTAGEVQGVSMITTKASLACGQDPGTVRTMAGRAIHQQADGVCCLPSLPGEQVTKSCCSMPTSTRKAPPPKSTSG